MLPVVALIALLTAAPSIDEILAAEKSGDDQRALDLARSLSAKQPGWHLARLESARLRLKLGVELDLAEADLEAARTRAPENPRAHYYWALLSLERGKKAEARRSFEQALLLKEDYAEARARLAGLCFAEQDWVCAEKHYREVVRVDPSPGNWLQLATALDSQDRLAEAEVLYKSVLLQSPDHPVATRRLADLYDRTDRPKLAAKLRGEDPKKKMRPLKKSKR